MFVNLVQSNLFNIFGLMFQFQFSNFNRLNHVIEVGHEEVDPGISPLKDRRDIVKVTQNRTLGIIRF